MARHDVVGALLVGGASRRFGSPKALAKLGDETLAERGYRTLREAFDHVIVVGKERDALPLPFPIVDDASEIRAAIVGIEAALRHADAEIVVVLPVDMPLVTADELRLLADTVRQEGVDAAVFPTGPLPAAIRAAAASHLATRVASGRLTVREAIEELGAVTVAGLGTLMNVNTVPDLERAATERVNPNV